MDIESQPPEASIMSHKRKRAPSRASTASVHSITTQPNLDQSFAAASHGAPNDHQWSLNGHATQHHGHVGNPQMPSGDVLLRPASQLSHHQSFSVEPSMQPAPGQHLSYQRHPSLSHPGLVDSFGANASFTDPDSQMLDRDEHEDGDSMAGIATVPKASSSRTSANNELEMRALFQSNKTRTLQDVATELHGNERGPNSERTRQVFAMLWINSVCSIGKGSVPRGRVYAHYASRCATERITVLNPASFGKLVRVLFPGLKTRRLGVRGESKYHYVNFMVKDDQPELAEPVIQPAIPFPETATFSTSFNTLPSHAAAPSIERSALPSPSLPAHSNAVATVQHSTGGGSKNHSLYNQPDVSSIDQLHSTTTKTAIQLSFASGEEPFQQSETLLLPRIEPFLPAGTDPDAAKSLTALYRSHCTSLIECIRYCKEKTFFHLFTSFQGTLTMPVQKLFSNPSLAPWIEQCDFVLYQRMMRIISGLTLQVVPKPVLDTLRNISERLVLHIRESFQGQPKHVVQAKEAPATIFAGLLDRALRVNLTAHAAANMLSNPANRDQMYLDWITMVRIRKVAECVPTRGMDDFVNLLVNELRDLLDPMSVPWEIEGMTLYGDAMLRNGRTPSLETSGESSGQNVLDRWVNFLRSLPVRFPYASPRDIVWCVQKVGTEVMRDLTIAQGKSFGSWWVTKCWVDEMVSFLAEQGGFLQQKNALRASISVPGRSAEAGEGSRQGSRVSSGTENLEGARDASNHTQAERASFSQMDTLQHDSLHLSTNPDDSGIGIRTPEEDFPVEKFEFPQSHGPALSSLGLEQSLP